MASIKNTAEKNKVLESYSSMSDGGKRFLARTEKCVCFLTMLARLSAVK